MCSRDVFIFKESLSFHFSILFEARMSKMDIGLKHRTVELMIYFEGDLATLILLKAYEKQRLD